MATQKKWITIFLIPNVFDRILIYSLYFRRIYTTVALLLLIPTTYKYRNVGVSSHDGMNRKDWYDSISR